MRRLNPLILILGFSFQLILAELFLPLWAQSPRLKWFENLKGQARPPQVTAPVAKVDKWRVHWFDVGLGQEARPLAKPIGEVGPLYFACNKNSPYSTYAICLRENIGTRWTPYVPLHTFNQCVHDKTSCEPLSAGDELTFPWWFDNGQTITMTFRVYNDPPHIRTKECEPTPFPSQFRIQYDETPPPQETAVPNGLFMVICLSDKSLLIGGGFAGPPSPAERLSDGSLACFGISNAEADLGPQSCLEVPSFLACTPPETCQPLRVHFLHIQAAEKCILDGRFEHGDTGPDGTCIAKPAKPAGFLRYIE
jgi:hypothetical protein